jgi:hypothetical protein
MPDTPEPPPNLAGLPPERPPPEEQVSTPIHDIIDLCGMAHRLAQQLPPSPEVSDGLQKLLEAKDCFVRARLP